MPHPLLGYFGLDTKTILFHHIRHNHYPMDDALATALVEPCQQAIDAVVGVSFFDGVDIEVDDQSVFDQPINVVLPEGVEMTRASTVGNLIDSLHLWDFVVSAVGADFDGDDDGSDDLDDES